MAASQTARVCKTYAVGATSITKDQHSYRPFDKYFWLTPSIPPTATRCISITRCVKPSCAALGAATITLDTNGRSAVPPSAETKVLLCAGEVVPRSPES